MKIKYKIIIEMSLQIDSAKLSQLTLLITECNKQYFIIKNQYHDKIEEIEKLMNSSVNFFELIDMQHILIKELEQQINSLYSELSFRKLIIERKEHVLRELNSTMINKFIDKIYKQEQIISEIRKENFTLLKYKNNTVNLANQYNESHKCNSQIINNITNFKAIPVNVIVPKSRHDYNGTLSFVNSSMKNIDKFINIKTVNDRESHKSKDKINIDLNKNKKAYLDTKDSKGIFKDKLKKKSKSSTKITDIKAFTPSNKGNLTHVSITCQEYSIISPKNLGQDSSRNIITNKTPSSLICKSYDIIKKYHCRKNHSMSNKSKILITMG